jgi:hypothetical protein
MQDKLKRIFCVLIILFFATISFAQEYEYKHYTVLDGLVQNQVTTLYQDQRGFIWIGTKTGISRFDGNNFKNFGYDEGVPKGDIQVIKEIYGRLYCYGTSSEIAVLSGSRFTKVAQIDKFSLRSLKYAKDSSSLFVIINEKLNEINSNGFHKIPNQYFNFIIYDYAFIDNGKKFLLLSDSGLFKFDSRSGLSKISDMVFTQSNVLNGKVYLLYNSPEKKLFHLFGIYCYNGYTLKRIFNKKKSDLRNFEIINDRKLICVLTSEATWELIDTTGKIIDCGTIPSFGSSHILIDREGLFWFGGESGLFSINSFAFKNYDHKCGLPDYVWSIAESSDSSIYFAGYMGGVSKLKNDKITKVPINIPLPYKYNLYMGAITNSKGEVMIPVSSKNILFCNNHTIKKLELPDKKLSPTAFSIFEDTLHKKYYFGTTNGVYIYDINKSRFNHIPSNGKTVLDINSDKYNRIWICSGKEVQICIDSTIIGFNENEVRVDFGVYTCCRDIKGNMWLGSKFGLFLHQYKSMYKILSAPFFFVKLYKQKFIIAGTIKGFIFIDLQKFYRMEPDCWKFFDKFNGFTGVECGQNGTCIDSKGNIWIPTSNKVVKFIPDRLSINPVEPNLYIYSFETAKRDLKWKMIKDIPFKKDSLTNIPWYENNIRITYQGISFSSPEKVKYKIRLLGYDDSWSDPTSESRIVYSNLPPGKYIFEIIACNDDGIWTKNPIHLCFEINPAFWQTWWFYPGITLIVLLLMLIAFRLQLKRIKKQAQLKQKMSQLEMDLLHMQIKPHFTGNSLMMIKDLIYYKKYDKALEAVDRFGVMLKFVAETTTERYITLEEELLILKNYINFQKLKPDNSIEFVIIVGEDVVLSEILIPPILLQPFVENSIDHGLRHKKGDGLIQIDINIDKENSDYILISILDNGVGRKKVANFETPKGKHKSIGIQNSTERLKNFNNSSFNKNIEIIDREDGTEVRIWLKKEA